MDWLWAGLHAELEHAPPFGVALDLLLWEIEGDAPACMPGARRRRVPLLLRPLVAKGVPVSGRVSVGVGFRFRLGVG